MQQCLEQHLAGRGISRRGDRQRFYEDHNQRHWISLSLGGGTYLSCPVVAQHLLALDSVSSGSPYSHWFLCFSSVLTAFVSTSHKL